jgi:hypothetical protein
VLASPYLLVRILSPIVLAQTLLVTSRKAHRLELPNKRRCELREFHAA